MGKQNEVLQTVYPLEWVFSKFNIDFTYRPHLDKKYNSFLKTEDEWKDLLVSENIITLD